MDKNIIYEIAVTCMRPETVGRIKDIENRFYRFNYEGHETSLEIFYADLDNYIDKSMEINNIYLIAMVDLLEHLGFRIVNDITFTKLYPIFMAITDIEYVTKTTATDFLNYLDTEEELEMAVSLYVSDVSDVDEYAARLVIDDIMPSFKDNVKMVLENLQSELSEVEQEDMEDEQYFKTVIMKVLKTLTLQQQEPTTPLWVLENMQGEFNPDIKLRDLTLTIWKYDTYGEYDEHTLAINILAMLTYASDSRFDRINLFNVYFQELIEDKNLLTEVYTIVQHLNDTVTEAFKKYDVFETIVIKENEGTNYGLEELFNLYN